MNFVVMAYFYDKERSILRLKLGCVSNKKNRASLDWIWIFGILILSDLGKLLCAKWKILYKLAYRKGKVYPREKRAFEKDLDKLFNILTCSCDFVDCGNVKCSEESCASVHINCKCPRDSMIPRLDLAYIKDQREKIGTKGQLQMALGDAKETTRQMKAMKRKEVEARRAEEREAKMKKEEDPQNLRRGKKQRPRRDQDQHQAHLYPPLLIGWS